MWTILALQNTQNEINNTQSKQSSCTIHNSKINCTQNIKTIIPSEYLSLLFAALDSQQYLGLLHWNQAKHINIYKYVPYNSDTKILQVTELTAI